MTRFRKTILASALVAASLSVSPQAHAYGGLSGFLGFFTGWWLTDAIISGETGTLRGLDL